MRTLGSVHNGWNADGTVDWASPMKRASYYRCGSTHRRTTVLSRRGKERWAIRLAQIMEDHL